jgi:hypothetical protein
MSAVRCTSAYFSFGDRLRCGTVMLHKTRKCHSVPGMGVWALRAETACGQSYDTPSEALLLRLLGELGPGNQFLVLDRVDVPGGEHYLQIYREIDGTYVIEYREGAADQHFETVAADLDTVFTVLTGWAAGAPGWREGYDWRRRPMP